MAIPFLNNINLDDNQLLNAKLHVTSSAPTAATGQIYYDSGATELVGKYYSGGWINISDTSVTGSTFITSTLSGTKAEPVYQVALSATGSPDSTKYLRGDNTWSPISTIPGTYTWDVSDGTNTDTVGSGFELIFAGTGGTTTSYNSGTRTLTIDSGNETITLTGEVTGSGTTSISTTVANNVLDINNFTAATIVTESEGIENNDNDTTIPTSAAVKDYVDSSVVGGLVYQGGYNAATNTPNLDSNPSPNPIKKGWTYTVTADGSFFTEQVRVGDVLIAENDAPTTLAEWTTVQNNIDLASLTQVGIGNVNASTDSDKIGLSVSYSSGTANIGFDVNSLTQSLPATNNTDAYIPYYDDDAATNKKITFQELAEEINTETSFAATISATGTITHNLGTRDIIIQLYDTVTYETVYADVDRISTTQATITFATTPTNSIRVLVQKIG